MAGAVMQIKNISRDEFNLLFPNACYIGVVVGHQVEWFTNEAGNILGTIGEDRTASDWLCAVLQRDDAGNFRVTKIANPKSLLGARSQLRHAMETT